jgi:hypothetical protein
MHEEDGHPVGPEGLRQGRRIRYDSPCIVGPGRISGDTLLQVDDHKAGLPFIEDEGRPVHGDFPGVDLLSSDDIKSPQARPTRFVIT